jgi:hypothetical protein
MLKILEEALLQLGKIVFVFCSTFILLLFSFIVTMLLRLVHPEIDSYYIFWGIYLWLCGPALTAVCRHFFPRYLGILTYLSLAVCVFGSILALLALSISPYIKIIIGLVLAYIARGTIQHIAYGDHSHKHRSS